MSSPGVADRIPVSAAVLTVLRALLDEERGLRDAVVNRNRDAVDASVLRSQDLLVRLDELLPQVLAARRAGGLSAADESAISGLRDDLRAAARQNSVLIEKAWGFDAAMLRLLANAARGHTEGGRLNAYSSTPAPTYLDRSA